MDVAVGSTVDAGVVTYLEHDRSGMNAIDDVTSCGGPDMPPGHLFNVYRDSVTVYLFEERSVTS